MARNLVSAGLRTTVWDRSPTATAPLSEAVSRRMQRLARTVYRVLKIRGLGRIDVRLTPKDEIVVIEANPNPSLAKEDDFAQSAIAAGVDYEVLPQKILDAAVASGEAK